MSTQKTMNDFNITQWAEETLALILRGEKLALIWMTRTSHGCSSK